ncbi:hypothetical protein I4641_11895 [Waterburya agarophytonicola K14]|uniref:Uncharacterized protein n=1 Tax=Waterburya agarophytonicola KI4 TaxID=2874699 RepID=A0A964BRV4_9CYAN|nr:hypothetical protein [Waterburya agarophytonicola]MCC0177681.1 hypothetical protein [Waterburya agarophytonicola KI4]
MHDFLGEVPTGHIDLIDVLADIRLINVTEIKIIQEVVSFIDTHYQEHKSMISPAKVAALILNRDDIPNLYATSFRGHNNQVLEFQNKFGINGFKIREKLVPWALDKIIRSGLPQSLTQDLAMAINTSRSASPLDDENLLEILATINLANVAEFQVIKDAVKCVNSKYPNAVRRINLSDVCALVLNHDVVTSLYATSEEEYNQLKTTYINEYQTQIDEVIVQIVDKIHKEGSEYSFSHDSLVAVNFQRRKKLTKFWNI